MNSKKIAGPEKSSAARYYTRFMHENERNTIIDRIEKFPSVTISSRAWSDIERLAAGAYLPFEGFAGEFDYRNSPADFKLSGSVSSRALPLLAVEWEDADGADIPGDDLILRDNDGKNIALLHLREQFRLDGDDVAIAGDIDIIRIENGIGGSIPSPGFFSVPGMPAAETEVRGQV